MPTPILATKLYLPLPRPKAVLRPRLIERLNAGISSGCKLTLISAPAGFGKTTLVSEWVAGQLHPVAWLSLDEGDNTLIRFLAYLSAALQTLSPNVGKGALAMLQSSQPLPTETVLTALLNEIGAIPEDFLLILDDYHVIDAQAVDQALTFLLEHLPPQMHLVIASREDPPLPLARLRVRNQLTELRAADLRFTPAEAADFLNQGMGLSLSTQDIAALEDRTEGWIAGLQLAAISMQGRADAVSFIQAFTGSHRFVLDYLVEEVLQRQPEAIRSFLLQTSILERLSGPLCDAVTGQKNGRGMLETLERGNLFVVALDDRRQWYRYHHLFGEVLRAHLTEAQPLSDLHRRASAWYEHNELPADAIRHALAGEDFERAAGLIELAHLTMDLSYQSATWLGWAQALPDELVRARPVLSVGYAWALLDGGELETCETRLRDAERWLNTSESGMIVGDEVQFRSLPASIATARAYRAMALGDIPAAMKSARLALELAPAEDVIRRTQATSLLGLAEYASGDLVAAEHSLSVFQANLHKTGEISTAIGIAFLLADIRMALGRLHEAENSYQQTLQLATSQGEPLLVGTADLYRGISELYCEWGRPEAATQHLQTAKKLGEQTSLTGWPHRLRTAEARVEEIQGNPASALDLLEEAQRLYVRTPLPDVRPIPARKARIWARQGRLTEALGWVCEQRLSAEDDLDYLREFEHITLARVLIARYQSERTDASIHAASQLLERLLQAAHAGQRTGSEIEIRVGQALAHQAQGDLAYALVLLERALELAEPEGYVRIFVDEGRPMAALLTKIEGKAGTPRVKTYVRQLLAAFEDHKESQPLPLGASQVKPASPHLQPLVESLSERELEVLKLLRTEMSGPEIARELVVSLNTLRTHTKNIFSKLGVNNRRAAVRRAEELNLF
jgi:LuxR family maltose regulon positive regulatory protein